MANKKDKMDGRFALQEQQDASGVLFRNSLNNQKRGSQQTPSSAPKNANPGSKMKSGGDKRQLLNNHDERSPWK
jgi:hypothetical protein